MTCRHCADNRGNYDFALHCCKVRYLMQEPRLEVRRAMLERWERKLGKTEASAIKAEFERQWGEKKKGVGHVVKAAGG